MRGGQVFKLGGKTGLKGAKLRHRERIDVHCFGDPRRQLGVAARLGGGAFALPAPGGASDAGVSEEDIFAPDICCS